MRGMRRKCPSLSAEVTLEGGTVTSAPHHCAACRPLRARKTHQGVGERSGVSYGGAIGRVRSRSSLLASRPLSAPCSVSLCLARSRFRFVASRRCCFVIVRSSFVLRIAPSRNASCLVSFFTHTERPQQSRVATRQVRVCLSSCGF